MDQIIFQAGDSQYYLNAFAIAFATTLRRNYLLNHVVTKYTQML